MLGASTDEIVLVVGNYTNHSNSIGQKRIVYNIDYDSRHNSLFGKTLKYSVMQIRLAIKTLLALKHSIDVAFVFTCTTLLLPVLTLKLMRKKVVVVITGFHSVSAKFVVNSVLSRLLGFVEFLIFNISDGLIVEAKSIISDPRLRRFSYKVDEASLFVDLDTFTAGRPPSTRGNLVGYVARLTGEKGILNFLEAIPLILREQDDIGILVVGDGPLRKEVENAMSQYSCIIFTDWIPLKEFPTCLKKIKLLVLPSYSEGLPNVVLEALACKTPVLATAVGGIPSVIKDGKTGFILPRNDPSTLAEYTMKCLRDPNINEVAESGYDAVRRMYNYSSTVERYKTILSKLLNKGTR